MKLKKYFIILAVCVICIAFCGCNQEKAYADELSDTVQDEINNLDLNGFIFIVIYHGDTHVRADF